MLSLLALALMLQGLLPSDPVGTYSSYLDGRRWDFVVSRADVTQGPRWRSTDDSPSLPPGAAVRSARALLPKLLPDANMEQWRVQAVELTQLLLPDAWVYVVTFTGPGPCANFVPPPGGGGCAGSGGRPEMRMVVLLNGTAVTPTSMPWTPGRH